MVVLVLNRAGISFFQSLYDFAGREFKRKMLWEGAVRERKVFSGVLPLLVSDMRTRWSSTVTCTDASPSSFGICERTMGVETIRTAGQWRERWRFKPSVLKDWKPRERALGLDPFKDYPRTARLDPSAHECSDEYVRNEEFEEVPVLDPFDWKVVLAWQWKFKNEHITLKEGRCLTLAVRRLSRSSEHRGKRLLVLVDNLALAFGMGKGRSCNHGMLRLNQKIGALLLACNIDLRVRWIPSEWNVSDGPSRGSNLRTRPKAFQHKLQQSDVERASASREDGNAHEDSDQEIVSEAGGEEGVSWEDQDQRQRGEESTKRWDDSAGDSQHQLRARVAVRTLHYRNFKDFCKENKFKISKKDQIDAVLADYFDVVFGKQDGSRRGEDTCKHRVLL